MRRRIAAALLAALLLTGCAPAAEPAAEPAEPAGEPVYMALTFDDGPSPAWTPRLLEGLSRRGARATFFLVGSQIEGREDLVRRIRQAGCTPLTANSSSTVTNRTPLGCKRSTISRAAVTLVA